MLYDPKWEQKTATPSLEGFIGWLETKDPKSTYNFCDPYHCAVAQYLQSLGWSNTRSGLRTHEINEMFGSGSDNIVNSGNMTFGAALKRAKNYQSTGNAKVAWTWKSLFKIF